MYFPGTCSPREDPGNFCNRLSGQLYIYGSDIDETVGYAQSVINFAITTALPQVQGIGVQRIETIEIVPVDDAADQGISGMLSLPLPVLCGLVISAVCIIFGFILLYFYMKKDRMRLQKLHKRAQSTMMESLSGSFRYFKSDGRLLTEIDNDSCTSEISSVQIDFENGAVSKIPTEKINVEFDPDYASSTGLVSDCSEEDRAPAIGATMSHPPHYLDGFGRYRD